MDSTQVREIIARNPTRAMVEQARLRRLCAVPNGEIAPVFTPDERDALVALRIKRLTTSSDGGS